MKKLFFTTLLLSQLTLCFSARADLINKICAEDFEAFKCQAGIIDKLQHVGDVQLIGTNIKDDVNVVGNLKTKNSTASSITLKGNASLDSTKISGTVTITGNADLTKSTFNSTANITGNVNCSESEIDGDVKIVGNLTSTQCHFKGRTNVTGDIKADHLTLDNGLGVTTLQSEFSNSNLQSIYVSKYVDNSVVKAQHIILKPGTVVNGTISFEANTGTVVLIDGAQLNGQVMGGNLMKMKESPKP